MNSLLLTFLGFGAIIYVMKIKIGDTVFWDGEEMMVIGLANGEVQIVPMPDAAYSVMARQLSPCSSPE